MKKGGVKPPSCLSRQRMDIERDTPDKLTRLYFSSHSRLTLGWVKF